MTKFIRTIAKWLYFGSLEAAEAAIENIAGDTEGAQRV